MQCDMLSLGYATKLGINRFMRFALDSSSTDQCNQVSDKVWAYASSVISHVLGAHSQMCLSKYPC